MNRSRFIVGIDLGTTNIALAYCDTAAASPEIQLFAIPQLIAPGEVRAENLYPAACWIPTPETCAPNLLGLPWQPENQLATGKLARQEGALQPNRYISSAKSWLCHSGVDRRKPILPWNPGSGQGFLSPLEVSTLYLNHLRHAWNCRFAELRDADGNPCGLENQQTVITIPASFDETARELTLAAAAAAGLTQVTLLEEPLAAFYAWLHRHAADWQQQLTPDSYILVVDVGGGTTDFSLVRYGRDGVLARTAAGEHLLLGGDNIDLALGKAVEQQWQTQLAGPQWYALLQQTRAAKEKLFSDPALSEVKVTVLSRGSSVIGGARNAVVTRAELERIVHDGFFPVLAADAPGPARKSGMQTMGLPYAADPSVTRHLLDFLRHANPADNRQPIRPSYILYNGGTMLPPALRNRLTQIVSAWFPDQAAIPELTAEDLELAVALGATAGALAARGLGPRVKCGTARSYYLETAGPDNRPVAICVMPHGTDENRTIACGRKFMLETNRKAEFPLYSSSVRTTDQAGDILTSVDELTPVSSLNCVLRSGAHHEHRSIATTVNCRLTETGLLQLELQSVDDSHQWPLHFDTRARSTASAPPSTSDEAIVIVNQEQIQAATGLIRQTLEAGGSPNSLMGMLETQLDLLRKDWPLPLLRKLADTLLTIDRAASASTDQESRWLNLTGFCLRPGFGDPADDLRLKTLWRHWNAGLVHAKDSQTAAEWWVCWRRVAPGLSAGQQRTVFQQLTSLLLTKGQYRTSGSPQERAEQWRCLGALELLPSDQKVRLGKILLSRGSKLTDAELWTLGRLGARRLFHAPANHLLPTAIAAEWVQKLLAGNGKNTFLLLALHLLTAATGDRTVDLSPEQLRPIKEFFRHYQAPEQWLLQLDRPELTENDHDRARILGDPLPLGLRLLE